MEVAIEAVNISKKYGSSLALNGFSARLEKGKTFALLGPNGAGKTTFVKLILGLIKPSSGEIKVNGISCSSFEARENIAYLPEKFNFFPYYTVKQCLAFFGKMRGVTGSELEQQINQALSDLNISELSDKKMGKLSKGQKQRVGIGGLLMGEAQLLIVDEPFSGLDPIGIKELKDLFKKLKESGRTLLINSHILSEMEQICDSIAILNKGECLALGEKDELLAGESLEDYFYKNVKGVENA